MRRTFARITLTAVATLGLAVGASVHALGLGEIDLGSNLNQRFVASIPLTDISAEDLETVTVSVAPNESFERAGIERAEYLSSLEFEIKNDRGRPRVVVTSSQIAREPVLDLLVQARWRGGKIQRDYTILLDPPVPPSVPAARAAVPAVATPAPIVAATPPPAAAKPVVPVGSEFYEPATDARPAPKPVIKAPPKAGPAAIHEDPAFDSATGSYGPVIAKETLWSIALKLRPDNSVTMDQMLLALAEANPVAIQRGTTVSQGATLRVPSIERIQSASPAEAKARLAALRDNGAPVVRKPATNKTSESPVERSAAQPTKPLDAALNAGAVTPAPAVVEPKPQAPAANTAAAPTGNTPTTAAPTTAPEPAAAPAATPQAATGSGTPTGPDTASAVAPAKSSLTPPPPEAAQSDWLAEYGLLLLVLLVLLMIAGLVWSRRRAPKDRKGSSPLKPGDTTQVSVPAGGAGALGRLGDKARIPQAVPAAGAEPHSPRPAATTTGPVAAQQSTVILAPQAVAAVAAKGGEQLDQTTRVEVDTLQINLSDDDPLSEADFHLAYGLYDEAILLLKTAMQKQPQRTDIQLKLAETYFAAGRPMEFQEIAEDLKPALSAIEWSKLAIMGSQICPGAAIFQGAETDAGLDADFDLAFDEPAAPAAAPASNTVEFSLSEPPSSTLPPLAATLAPMDQRALDVDFDLQSAAGRTVPPAAQQPPPSRGSVPPVGLDDDASIDFMLGQSLTPLGAGLRVPDHAGHAFDLHSPSFKVDVPKLDGAQPSYSPPSQDATLTQVSPLSLSLQDLEVSITPRESDAESMDADLNTKLDLARAYVEMGDNDMARSLLVEVKEQGSERHQQEAASLLQRLPA